MCLCCSSFSTATPFLRANPSSAGVGLPAASRPTFTEGPADIDRPVGSGVAHGFDLHREPPRCCEPTDRAIGAQKAILSERLRQRVRKRLPEAGERFGRQLFGEKLDEERVRAHAATASRLHIGNPSASRDAKYACATSRDSARTRAMYAARSVTEIAPRASSRLKVCEHLSTIS